MTITPNQSVLPLTHVLQVLTYKGCTNARVKGYMAERRNIGKGCNSNSNTVHERALVTAIVTTYNSGRHIQETLESLRDQSWENLHIIVGDDCSTDETRDILAAFLKDNPSTQLILRDENLGWIENTNDLLRQCRGEYAFFAFHDDVLMPDFVSRMVSALESDPDASLAFSDVLVVDTDEGERLWSFTALDPPRGRLQRGLVMGRRPASWWTAIHGVFRLSAAHRIGGLHSNAVGEFGADWPWLMHLSLLGRFIHVDEVLVTKRFTSNSLSRSWEASHHHYRAWKRTGIQEIRQSTLTAPTKWIMLAYLYLFTITPSWVGRTIVRARRRLRG